MIGKIIIGKSFRGCLKYCLHDKLQQTTQEEQIMKDRAEIICFNQCFGNDKELIRQFNEVRALNPRLAKPVLHITLSLAPAEKLPNHILSEMVSDCAREMGFEKNQYLAVLHKDTLHQHIHIVTNRIGFDGKTLSDSNNYKKIAAYCRKMEDKYQLQEVLSPGRFLSKELKKVPRMDARKEQLRSDIKTCLASSRTYLEFEQQMISLRYEIIKGRGIAFVDPQKVYTKGSDVGYSLATIEKNWSRKAELQSMQTSQPERPFSDNSRRDIQEIKELAENQELNLEKSRQLKTLLSPSQPFEEQLNPAFMIKKKRRKRKRQRL
ncbi:relaxase/mobilization nuclease domain protein [Ostertagia ostertagi]